ncbi:amidase signature enzyme [Hypoxylon rubiginosum]|uniref:Amidase signature enzyme n=1 Tax=Hypoxylon rubiginosum TaxID=110542 RepID=A0ACC0CW43_9PEZI|nr:amidase signature enzyme [Hypoxylon rubiginosum]
MLSSSILLLLAAARLAKADLVDNGSVVSLEGIPYYVGGVSIGQLDSTSTEAGKVPGTDLFPITVIDTPGSEFQGMDLLDITGQYDEEDDVFQPAFLGTIYLRSGTASSLMLNETDLGAALSSLGTSLLITSEGVSGDLQKIGGTRVMQGLIDRDVSKGPYFVSAATGKVFKAHRLYGDDNLAFIQGVVSDEEGGYTSLPAVTENVMTKSIAVPSRLYYTASEEQPLAGLRFGVKDIYHVKGVGTSGGNRAYYYLYGARNATCPSIQRLIDLGAVLVGKMGTVQFANGDKPTADWVDFHAPFNPRGDGYQLPSGSSTGSGAGIASYDWLDIAVGSDTGGSMRGPAGASGVFGGRPSTGAISMDGVMPLSPVSDSAGIFARSASLWAKATQAWYPNMTSNYTSHPSVIHRSKWLTPVMTPEARTVVDDWVAQVEAFLGVNATEVDVPSQWAATHGDAPENLAEMLNLTYGVYITHDQWKLLGEPFFADYAAAHGGRKPFVNPGPLSRWTWGQTHAPDDVYEQALRNITYFKSWWEADGFGRHDPESCSESLYIYAFATGAPAYRTDYLTAPTGPPLGFTDQNVAIIAGVPELVVPVGEVPYQSAITGQTEYLPVTMALRMARNCDYALANLVSDLEEAGILRGVVTGSRIYA